MDLVYLDPPFNSNANYNVLFAEKDGSKAAGQIQAFTDTWSWGHDDEEIYAELVMAGGKLADCLKAFRTFLGPCDMLAYLVMMAPRLVELRRVMKTTASIYLHCDPSASHYLKILLDSIFGADNFRNEIVWRRTGAHNKIHRYAPIHDIILFYSKTSTFNWTSPKKPFMKGHVEENFVKDELGYRTDYYGNVLTGSGLRNGESGQPWRGFDPSKKGRHWAIPGALLKDIDEDLSNLSQHQKFDRLFELGFIKIIEGQAWPIYERRLGKNEGQALSDIWSFQPYTNGTVFNTEDCIDQDVRWLSTKDQERLGYPTQKPVGLLERIITASSGKGGVVLDPFCGCGTTIDAAQKLGRTWIGIDITHLAITLIKQRLADSFGILPAVMQQKQSSKMADGGATSKLPKPSFQVLGEPTSVPDAEALAASDPYQFQWWALGLVGARPVEQKKGADQGIDGKIVFQSGGAGVFDSVIISVKAGKTGASHIRDLKGVLEREKAAIGVLISMQEPTQPMETEAVTAGFYESQVWGRNYPKIQLLTVEELLNGKAIDMPPIRQVSATFKKAPKSVTKQGNQMELSV